MRNTLCCLLLATAAALAQTINTAPQNIAANKPYELEPTPNYALCTDAGDVTQLTDGKKVSGLLWAQPGCVGWSGHCPVVITVDLQRN